MNKVQALHKFWQSFGLETYEETTVPDDAGFPRLTYSVATDCLGGVVSLHADIWFYSNSWKGATDTADAIARKIEGEGFVTVPFDGGYIYLCGGTPFAQRIDDPTDDSIKRIYINVQAEFLSAY